MSSVSDGWHFLLKFVMVAVICRKVLPAEEVRLKKELEQFQSYKHQTDYLQHNLFVFCN